MARIKVRHLVVKPGRNGLPRYFWQPSAALRAQGHAAQRIPDHWRDLTDAGALKTAAIAAAEALNAQLDAARATPATAAKATPRPSGRSVDDLVKAYRASAEFKALRKSTRRGYEQCLERIGTWAGDAPFLAITPKRVKALKESYRATPAFRNAIVRVLRLLYSFAISEEWTTVNPATKPGLESSEPSGVLWPREAVVLFAAAADRLDRSSIGTAVMLDEWIGQREGDVLRLPRNLLTRNAEGTATLRQSKGGVVVNLPIGMVPHLVARVDAELERLARRFKDATVQPATLIVSEETGQPYKEDNFRHRFAEIRSAMAAAMRREQGWTLDPLTGAEQPPPDVAAAVRRLPPPARAKALAAHARRAASFAIDYLMPGREPEEPDAFRLFVDELQFMHLRHTAVTRLAEAECDDQLISIITGHSPSSVKQILQRYMVRTRKLARLAFQKRLDAEGTAVTPATEEQA